MLIFSVEEVFETEWF